MADVIIVLARGIQEDGSIPEEARSRVRKGVALYRSGNAMNVVMSGSWSYHFDIAPPRTEAAAMKEYAEELGVDSDFITEETQSKDTLGNAYFTKKICERNRWRDIIIVASDDHMPRVKYLFNKVYGPRYNLNFEESERVLDEDSYKKELIHEESSMRVTKKWLDGLSPGDDQSVWDLLQSKHPAYSNNKQSDPEPEGEDLYPNLP